MSASCRSGNKKYGIEATTQRHNVQIRAERVVTSSSIYHSADDKIGNKKHVANGINGFFCMHNWNE